MASDPRKRQKKLARLAAKRKAKHHQIARAKSIGTAEQIAAAADDPVLDSLATSALWNGGMGYVLLSRVSPRGSVAFGCFLVDRYCLGVKDAMSAIKSRHEYDALRRKLDPGHDAQEIAPETARKFVEGAVAYAKSLGFPPHPDYHRARPIFGTLDAAQSTGELEFGQDGKPHFIAGPYDDSARCRQVLATLERHCGPGGYHYTLPIGGSSNLPADLVEVDEFDD